MTTKYEKMREDIHSYLMCGRIHATLVGKVISLGGSTKSDSSEATDFANYIVDLVQKEEQFRKDNVKNSKS
jgi:hypothetical protein